MMNLASRAASSRSTRPQYALRIRRQYTKIPCSESIPQMRYFCSHHSCLTRSPPYSRKATPPLAIASSTALASSGSPFWSPQVPRPPRLLLHHEYLGYCFGFRMNVEFFIDILEMDTNGLRTDEQLTGDLLMGYPLNKKI